MFFVSPAPQSLSPSSPVSLGPLTAFILRITMAEGLLAIFKILFFPFHIMKVKLLLGEIIKRQE